MTPVTVFNEIIKIFYTFFMAKNKRFMAAGLIRNAVIYNNKGDFCLSVQPDNSKIAASQPRLLPRQK
jgi:hypothetical protein